MSWDRVEPEGWTPPKGYSSGALGRAGGRPLFVAGQVSWDEHERLVGPGDFASQFRQALSNFVTIVRAGGGCPADIATMTVFVSDKDAYVAARREIGAAWRDLVGRSYPAMALVEVASLLEEGAMVEIQGIAWVGGRDDGGEAGA